MLHFKVLAIACLLGRGAYSQCADECDGIRSPYDVNCGEDPNDGSMFGVGALFCSCQANEQLAVRVVDTGVNCGSKYTDLTWFIAQRPSVS